jgi:Ca2+-binding RTX toxin-like protein
VQFDTVPGPGGYFVGLVVDSRSELTETNEANNTALTSTKVLTVISTAWPGGIAPATIGNDIVTVQQTNKDVFVTVNGVTKSAGTNPASVFIDAAAGNDKVFVAGVVKFPLHITGGGGNDTIVGGQGEDELSGANGKDKVFGGGEDDYLLGGASADYLNGEDGDDTCSGAGGNDRIISNLGRDYLLGGAGDDVIVSVDIESGFTDTLSGGAGSDRGQVDPADLLASIEQLL